MIRQILSHETMFAKRLMNKKIIEGMDETCTINGTRLITSDHFNDWVAVNYQQDESLGVPDFSEDATPRYGGLIYSEIVTRQYLETYARRRIVLHIGYATSVTKRDVIYSMYIAPRTRDVTIRQYGDTKYADIILVRL